VFRACYTLIFLIYKLLLLIHSLYTVSEGFYPHYFDIYSLITLFFSHHRIFNIHTPTRPQMRGFISQKICGYLNIEFRPFTTSVTAFLRPLSSHHVLIPYHPDFDSTQPYAHSEVPCHSLQGSSASRHQFPAVQNVCHRVLSTYIDLPHFSSPITRFRHYAALHACRPVASRPKMFRYP
jgi:hypothetical protein